MKKVLIIESRMTRYRVPFYSQLYMALLKEGIQLQVGYSDPLQMEAVRGDSCDLPPEIGLKVRAHWFLGD